MLLMAIPYDTPAISWSFSCRSTQNTGYMPRWPAAIGCRYFVLLSFLQRAKAMVAVVKFIWPFSCRLASPFCSRETRMTFRQLVSVGPQVAVSIRELPVDK